jgi:uncharacterized OsmC-like protein
MRWCIKASGCSRCHLGDAGRAQRAERADLVDHGRLAAELTYTRPDPDVRNGYERIGVRFTVKGDAPAEKLREIVAQSRARSAVYDIITNRVPVTIEVETA